MASAYEVWLPRCSRIGRQGESCHAARGHAAAGGCDREGCGPPVHAGCLSAGDAREARDRRPLSTRRARGVRSNLDSVYYPAALVLALVDLPLDATLRGCLVSAVYAYGSMAAPGRATRNSDLDLMLVGDIPDHDALTARLAELGRNLGRAIDAFMLTPEQLEAAQARGDAHVAAALAGVRVRGRV